MFNNHNINFKAIIYLLTFAVAIGAVCYHSSLNTQPAESTEITEPVQPSAAVEDTDPAEENLELVVEEEPEPEEPAVTHLEPRKVHGIYVTAQMAGTDAMADLEQLVNDTDLNTMVIDVKNDDGNITYAMDCDLVNEYDSTDILVADMPSLIQELHDQDIYVIGRIVCFKDPVLAEAQPELALTEDSGEAVGWVNPTRQEVWEYLVDIAIAASETGFDEIQFDYVRFPIGKSVDYGVDMEEHSKDYYLNQFFDYAADRLHSQDIIFGADLFGTVIGSPADMAATGQDYATLATKADNLCPMIYPSHYANGNFGLDVPDAHPYECISGALDLSVQELASIPAQDCAIIRPWLQCFSASWVEGHITYNSAAIAQEIQAVYDAGYDEWILWNAVNNYKNVPDALAH